MMNLVVKRSKWLRGEEDSYLVRGSDKKMCCLGFLGRQCNITQKEMLDIGLPNRVDHDHKFPSAIIETDKYGDSICSMLCDEIVHTNDTSIISDKQRERKLTQLFKKADIAITFVD